MAYVERMDFEGFWGDRKFSIHFDPEVNFLIGVNDSGKTTAINALASPRALGTASRESCNCAPRVDPLPEPAVKFVL